MESKSNKKSYRTFKQSHRSSGVVKISKSRKKPLSHDQSTSSSTSWGGESISDEENAELVPILLQQQEPGEEAVDLPEEEEFYTIRKDGEGNQVPPVLMTNAMFDKLKLKRLLWGVAYSLFSGAFIVASTSIDKYLGPKVSPWHVILAVGVGNITLGFFSQMLVLLIDGNGARQRDNRNGSWMDVILGPDEVRTKIIVQGILGALSAYGLYHAIQTVKINDAEAIFYSTPLLTFAFSSCLLGESFRLFRLTVSIILMAGLIFTTEPELLHPVVRLNNGSSTAPDEEVHVIGFVQSFCVPLSASLIAVMARKCFLQKQLTVNLVIVWMGIFILLTTSLAAVWNIIPPLGSEAGALDWVYVALIALADTCGVWFFLQSQKYLSPSCTAVLKTVDVVIILIIALIIEAQWDWSMLAGVFLLFVACIFMCIEELFHHKIPARFKFIF